MARRISTVIRAGVLALLLAVPLVYSSRLQNSFGLPKQVLTQAAVAVLLLLFGAQVAAGSERFDGRATPADIPVLALLAWLSISSVFSLDRPGSMRELLYAASVAGLFFLVTRRFDRRGWALALVAVIAAMGAAESAYGIAERLGAKLLYEARVKESVPSYDISAWRWDILGTFGNPNHLASYLVLSCPILFGFVSSRISSFLRSRRPHAQSQRWAPAAGLLAGAAALAGLILCLACLILTGARGSWVAAAAGILLTIAWGLRRGSRSAFGLAAASALLLALSLALVNLLNPRTTAELAARVSGSLTDSTGSMRYRMLGWKIAARMIAERPVLGSGPMTFKLRFLPSLAGYLEGRDPLSHFYLTEKMNEAHNEFLQAAAETGLPGLALLLLALASVFRGITRNLRAAGTADGFVIAGGAAALGAAVLDAVSSITFHVVPTHVAFWALAGALLAWRPGAAPAPAPAPPPPPAARRWTAASYLAVFAALSLFVSARELRCDYYFKTATTMNYMRRMPEALHWFRKALGLFPSSGQLGFYTGSTLVHLGRYAEGAALLERSAVNFQDIYLYKNLGIAYERLGRLDDAAAQYARWRAMGIASTEANNLIGFARLRQGRVREAEETFRETLRVRPWDLTAFSALAALYIDTGRCREAVASLNPGPLWKTPDAFTIYGVALLRAGRADEAGGYFLKAIELDPRSVKAHNNLGALRYMRGDAAGALREWEASLGIEPDNAVALKNSEAARKKIMEGPAPAPSPAPQSGGPEAPAQGLTQFGACSPLSIAARFAAAVSAIRARVSALALPMWGSNTALSSPASPSARRGSSS